jgi:hypothetical protein
MNRVKLLVFVGFSAMLVFVGCAKEQQFEAIDEICLPGVKKAAAMEAAEGLLSEMHFTVAKSDSKSGYIRSGPLPGAQAFEFWRKDNVGDYNRTQANLHSIRRIVEFDISQQERKLCIGCDVNVERLNMPEYEVTSSAQAYRMFSRSGRSRQQLEANPAQEAGMRWFELGKDTRLSTEILKQLKEKLRSD